MVGVLGNCRVGERACPELGTAVSRQLSEGQYGPTAQVKLEPNRIWCLWGNRLKKGENFLETGNTTAEEKCKGKRVRGQCEHTGGGMWKVLWNEEVWRKTQEARRWFKRHKTMQKWKYRGVGLKGKRRNTRGHTKENTDDGKPPKALQTMEESLLDRYSPHRDVV